MKKIVLKTSVLAVILLLMLTEGEAQNYNSAVGVRLGLPVSISYKQFLNESNAFEVYGGAQFYPSYNQFNVSAAYQIHKPLDDIAEGLNYYYGGGVSAFFWNYKTSFTGVKGGGVGFGLQGYLGLDYTLKDTPVNFTVDWVPTFIINNSRGGFGVGYGSLGIRYVLGGK